MNPLISFRIRRAEKRLLAVNAEWRSHTAECVRCRLAATGNRAARRAVRGRFCGEGGRLLLKVEAELTNLKALYGKKVQQPAANAGQAPA